MFDCCGVRFVSPEEEKKPDFQNGQKSHENRTNMDIILSFLSKPVDKHGITLVHITYPPLLQCEIQYINRLAIPISMKPSLLQHRKNTQNRNRFF